MMPEAAVVILTVFVCCTGAAVVAVRTPWRQVFAIAVHGLVLSLLFVALGAPDVAFSELTVGTVALPLLFLVVLATVRINRTPSGPDAETP